METERGWPVIPGIGKLFPNYCQLFEQLEIEYALTPSWRFFKQQRILRDMGRLNKRYSRWFDAQLIK